MVASRKYATLVWLVPSALVLAALFMPAAHAETLWMLCYAVMGTGCAVNARGCGRVHCHFTAPWFLLVAGLMLLYAGGFIPEQWLAADVIAVAGLVGAMLIWAVTEKRWGRYRASADTGTAASCLDTPAAGQVGPED